MKQENWLNRLLARPSDERGQVFIYALIMLALGSLIIGPLLSYMSTGLNTGQIFSEKATELYAADAGVADAIWYVNSGALDLPTSPSDPALHYTLDQSVNGKSVTVDITNVDEVTYKILSTAQGPLPQQNTSIESYLTVLNFNMYTVNALTSPTSIVTQPGDVINGNVQAPAEGLDLKGTINGDIITDPIKGWPTAGAMSAFFGKQVSLSNPYPSSSIMLHGSQAIPSLYRDGDLTISTSSNGSTGVIQGTIYVTGNLNFPQSGNKNYTIDLNGQTIYVQGAIDFPSYRCSVKGPGAIIALGDINFQPGISSNGFTFIMSVAGEVTVNPSGTLYGSVAGGTILGVQPDWVIADNSNPDLNLPEQNSVAVIETWKIR